VKKLLTFLIMLVVGMALFAVPVTDEFGAISTLNTVEAVPQQAGVFTTVTDVFLAIVPAENSCSFINNFAVFAINDNLFGVTRIDSCPYRQEVSPFYGYSKTAALGMIECYSPGS
jgi:hypothetical protein